MSTSNEAEIGTLIVVVLKARNLIDKHSFYKQDAYAQTTLNGTVKKTPVEIKGGQHPVWDAELRYPIMKSVSEKTRKLEISCFSKESRADALLGKGTVDIGDTLKTGEFDEWVPLGIDGVMRGEVYLEMTYFSSAAPPISNPKPSVSSLLVVPSKQNLKRHPSKLNPAERLSRPPQSTNPQSFSRPNGSPQDLPRPLSGLAPPRDTTNSLSPVQQDRTSSPALPTNLFPGGPKPNAAPLPSLLRPGYGKTTAPNSQTVDTNKPLPSPSPSSSPPLPSSLRPATVPARVASPSYASSQYTSPQNQPPSQNPYLVKNNSATNAIPQSAPSNISPPAYPSYPSYTSTIPAPTAPPVTNPYMSGSIGTTTPAPEPPSSFFFPVPSVAPPIVQAPMYSPMPYQPSYAQPDSYLQPRYQTPLPDTRERYSPRPDPYLQARYQTPLPLPPGAEKEKPVQPTSPQSPPVPVNVPQKPKVEEPKPEDEHLKRLRLAEEAANRRHEQEQRDLEIAMKLDRELNMG